MSNANVQGMPLSAIVEVADKAFYEGKVAAAKFFAAYNLPKVSAERAIAEAVDNSLMEISEDAF